MTAIASIDNKNGIGKNNNLLVTVKEDMKFFKNVTTDNVIIMGKNTLFSFKNKLPLKNRINIVFTHDTELKNNYKNFKNIFFVSDKSELYDILSKYKDKEHFLIGGAKIYDFLIDDCDLLYLTKFDYDFGADAFFPNFYKKFSLFSKTNDKYFIYNNTKIKYNFYTYFKSRG